MIINVIIFLKCTNCLQISVLNLRLSTTNRPVVAMGRYSQYLEGRGTG